MTEEKELHVPFLDPQGRIWCDRLNTVCNGKNGSASCGECYDWMRHFVEGKFGFDTNYNMGMDVLRRLREACLRVMELEAKLAARPEGVPTEPTPDMCAAGGAVVLDHILFDRGADGELDPHGKARVGMDNAAKVYAAMVKAHSSPQKETENGSM